MSTTATNAPAPPPTTTPPGTSSWAGKVIAVVVFLGVIVAIVSIAFMPERTSDFEDTVRLYAGESVTVRLVGERGMLEISNEGPLPVVVSSPVEGAPLDGPIVLQPATYVRRDIRGVGAFEVRNGGEAVTTIRWRGGGPDPIHVAADPVR